MSISHLQSIFALRTGRDILPENLPMDVLISLARELAFMNEGSLEHTEIYQLKICLLDMVERLLRMQPISRLLRFKEKEDELLPALVDELNKCIRNELVNRLIGHHATKVQVGEAFEEHFLE